MIHYALVQLRVGEVSTGQFSKDRVGPNTTSLAYVSARDRDVVVSATRLDDRPDLDTIEHLDFAHAIPCECSPDDVECDEVAELVLQDTPCTSCGIDDGRWLCSLACWDDMGTGDDGSTGVICICGAAFHRDDVLRIIGRLS